MEFIKKDAKKLKRVGMSWRKQTGKKNKTKVGKKGHRPMPSEGFRGRKSQRHMIAGLMPVRVFTPSQVDGLSDKNIAIIASAVGAVKRKLIIEKCNSKGIKVKNNGSRADNAEKAGK